MMKKILLPAILLCAFASLHAQDLKTLPPAPEITVTQLPNGITCYVTTNKETKGHADFALVQQPMHDRQEAVAQARKALVSLPHFGRRRPCDFLAGLGVGYTENGYVNFQNNATIYDFRRVPVTNQAVADSMLLMIFDIAELNPSPQALIVCGDVDPAKFNDRMKMFSLTVSQRQGPGMQDSYTWTPKPEASCYFTGNPLNGVASIRVSFAGARTPMAQMNTLQPAVSKQYASYLGDIIENRVRADFKAQGIPLAEVRFRYYDSASGPGDEQYTITVITSAARYDDAVKRFATVLADLDSRGAGKEELQNAKDRFQNETARDAGNTLSNSEYVRRCISAYLYNSSLASANTINGFFKNGRLAIEKELELFNNFASALLDSQANLTIGFDTPRAHLRTDLADTFRNTWDCVATNPDASPAKPSFPDSLSLWKADSKSRVKIKAESKDPISGGDLWTFTNGMKVVYRKTAEKGKFHYTMMLRGGAGKVVFLKPGESAFIGDMLENSEISGMHPDEFQTMLMSNGITMNSSVSLRDLRIEGTAPSHKLQMVLHSLLSMANERKPDPEAFAYYKNCEALRIELSRLSQEGIDSYMDSLLCPAYLYPDYKRVSALSDDLPAKAEKFFDEQFSRCQDGVLVITGDLEPEALKKELCNNLGGFRTSRIFDALPKASRPVRVGTSTYTVNSREAGLGDGSQSVHLYQSAPLPYNLVNAMSMKVAMILLQQELSRTLAPVGAYASVDSRLEVFPEERMFVQINSAASVERGLPEGISYAEPYDILSAIREAIGRVSSTVLSPAALNACKDELSIREEAELQTDLGRMNAVLTRYSVSKDIVSEYKQAIAAVTADSVAAVFKALLSGGCIETVLL